VKPTINSVEGHPQLNYIGHPVDGALVGASSLWPISRTGFGTENNLFFSCNKIESAIFLLVNFCQTAIFKKNKK